MHRSRRAALVVLLAVVFACRAFGAKTSILETPHNLSVSGPGEIKSVTETRICIFCHSSHNAATEGPLWNHRTTTPGNFRTYERSTLAGGAEQPNGATKLCLSCHDGTVAVGAVRGVGGDIPMQNVGARGEIPVHRSSHLGRDLTGTHPVSIKFSEGFALRDRNLRWPPDDPTGEVGVDAAGYVQCTSCHDPHGSRSERYPFWRKSTFGQVCVVCHDF
jgi:predicted CXXCH cytochrome family protein